MKGLKVLIVDDEPLMRLSMLDALEAVGCEVTAASTGTEGLAILGTRQFDIVITDLRLPGADGLTILRASKERSPTTEVILITAHGSVDTAVGAINLGAYDYVTKPFQMDELLLIVERVGKIIGLRRENSELKEVLEGRFSFSGMHGCSHHMRGLLERIKLLAARVEREAGGRPGEVLDDALTVACATGAIAPLTVQRAGRAAMSARDLLRGFAILPGTILS